jgi:hypothetical protein
LPGWPKLAQDRLLKKIEATVDRARRTTEDASALELIRIVVDAYLDMFEHPSAAERALIVMWGASFPSESSIEGMLEADRYSYDGWGRLLARGQGDGSIRADVDVAAASVVLLGLTRGVAALFLAGSGRADRDRVRATCDGWITAALAPHLESGPTRRGPSGGQGCHRPGEQVDRDKVDRCAVDGDRDGPTVVVGPHLQDDPGNDNQNSFGAGRSRAETRGGRQDG